MSTADLAAAGANVFAAGPAIFKSSDPADAVKRMRATTLRELEQEPR